jgi:hypothetical protein
MVPISKRAAGVGAAVAMIVTAGPVAVAGAATVPVTPPAIVANVHTQNRDAATWNAGFDQASAPFQAGAAAAIGGWNAGADAAVGGFNAGAAALGLPFQFAVQTGPLGLHGAAVAPLAATP